MPSYSCIDHYLISAKINDKFHSCYVYNSDKNLSNHSPIVLGIDLCVGQSEVNVLTGNTRKITPWYKIHKDFAVINQYNQKLNHLLRNLEYDELLKCKDLKCCQASHKNKIDELCNDIVRCCLLAADVFPTYNTRVTRLPSWNTDVKPYHKENLLWHKQWIQMGRPKNGVVFENMREARRQYKYAVKRAKKHELKVRYQRMAEAVSNNQSRDFFKELKKMSSKPATAPNIGGKTDSKDIAEHLAYKYKVLYNSVPSDDQFMDQINKNIECGIKHTSHDTCKVSTDVVAHAISKLKREKSDGNMGLSSSHLIIAKDIISPYIASLATAVLVHGYYPRNVLLATVCSIPKDPRANLCDESNYRGIALCSPIGKVLDKIFLLRNERLLHTSSLQFAFKKNHGTTMCTMVAKDIMDYYL